MSTTPTATAAGAEGGPGAGAGAREGETEATTGAGPATATGSSVSASVSVSAGAGGGVEVEAAEAKRKGKRSDKTEDKAEAKTLDKTEDKAEAKTGKKKKTQTGSLNTADCCRLLHLACDLKPSGQGFWERSTMCDNSRLTMRRGKEQEYGVYSEHCDVRFLGRDLPGLRKTCGRLYHGKGKLMLQTVRTGMCSRSF